MKQSGRASSFGHGVARVFELSLGQMLWSRRTIFMALILVVLILIAAAIRIASTRASEN